MRPRFAHSSLCRRRHNRRSEEHTSELQSRLHLVCRLLLEKKKKIQLISPLSHTSLPTNCNLSCSSRPLFSSTLCSTPTPLSNPPLISTATTPSTPPRLATV